MFIFLHWTICSMRTGTIEFPVSAQWKAFSKSLINGWRNLHSSLFWGPTETSAFKINVAFRTCQSDHKKDENHTRLISLRPIIFWLNLHISYFPPQFQCLRKADNENNINTLPHLKRFILGAHNPIQMQGFQIKGGNAHIFHSYTQVK